MPTIRAQSVPKKSESVEDILAQFCYYFPQYTLKEADNMPFFRIRQMLKVVRREQARHMMELTQVVSAPHTRRGTGVQKMLKYFKDIIER